MNSFRNRFFEYVERIEKMFVVIAYIIVSV